MTDRGRRNLKDLTAALMAAFPELDDVKRRVALATYRRLARGKPASPQEIATQAVVGEEEVRRILAQWIGVYRDREGNVIAFWGLATPEMKHHFEVDGVRLHTWCAWDTLFLPALLRKTARVESPCGTSGEIVRLTISPAGVESAEPPSPVLSFLDPVASKFQENVIQNFCHYVHFFRSTPDGEAWITKNPGTFLLTPGRCDGARAPQERSAVRPLRKRMKEPEIILIYDDDCPNVEGARALLREALGRVGLETAWVEYDRSTPAVPGAVVHYGSPTILVDGIDVVGEPANAAAACCRIYSDERRLRGVPPVQAIVDTILRTDATRKEGG
jgi:alkylmercury lyase